MHNYNHLKLLIITQFNIKQEGIQGFPFVLHLYEPLLGVSIHLRYLTLQAFQNLPIPEQVSSLTVQR